MNWLALMIKHKMQEGSSKYGPCMNILGRNSGQFAAHRIVT